MVLKNITLNLLDYGRGPFVSLREFRVGAIAAVLDAPSSDIDKKAKTYSEFSDRFGFLRNLAEIEVMGPR